MLDTIANQLRKKGINPEKAKMPKHIALTVGGIKRWTRESNAELKEAKRRACKKVEEIIKYQLCFDIPIITLYLVDSKIRLSKDFTETMDILADFFVDLSNNKEILRNKIKISILGKWYDLPSRVVEPIKIVIDQTKEYDNFFLNLCINYNGKEEIVDACKIIVRKALMEKTDVDSITEETIKDNIYSSYFLPPEIIVKTGTGRRLHGFLLWDSSQSIIYFSDVSWIEFKEKQLINAIKYYQENKSRV